MVGNMAVTVWILGDQLLDKHPALIAAEEHVSRDLLEFLVSKLALLQSLRLMEVLLSL